MNAYVPEYNEEAVKRETHINGVSNYGAEIIYSAVMGEVCGLFKKVLQRDVAEGLVFTSREVQLYKISAYGESCAVSVGYNAERHIAIFNVNTGSYRELTEGEVSEDYPSYSRDGRRIYFSSAGLALSPGGVPVGIGTYGVFCYYIESNEMDELLASESHDYLAPKEDINGDLLFMKRPHRRAASGGNLLMDIIMFPVRIVRAIGGLLNYFSILFGGESLRSGQPGRDVKSKQMSEKDLFFDGNVLNAQQTLRENERRGEKYPGIIPHDWELIRIDRNGYQQCLKKGVMDYMICNNGDIVYSNGVAIIRLFADGSEQLVEKSGMADNLVEVFD